MGKRKGILDFEPTGPFTSQLGEYRLGGNQGMWGNSMRERRDHLGVERLLALLDSDRIRIYLGLADPQVERLRQIAVETEKANVKTRAEIEVREHRTKGSPPRRQTRPR